MQTRPRTLVHAIDLPDEERVVIKKNLAPQGMEGRGRLWQRLLGVVDPILMVDPGFDLKLFANSQTGTKLTLWKTSDRPV